MNPMKRQNKRAFSIVELLTVMSIITILISLLVPGLNRVRRFARRVRQKAQFHSIEVGLDMFYTEREEYPESTDLDSDDVPYCGAMKLAEAMMGQDLLGFHPDSVFRHDGYGPTGTDDLYPDAPSSGSVTPAYAANLRSRLEVGLQLENANAYRVGNVFGQDNWGSDFDGEELVLCDVYTKNKHEEFDVGDNHYDGTGKKIGMPILYYRAHESRTKHYDNSDYDLCIYDYRDNDQLVQLGMSWNNFAHPIAGATGQTSGQTEDGVSPDPKIFYDMIQNENIPEPERPYKSDSYILISAGFDGQYGTNDDVFNFEN